MASDRNPSSGLVPIAPAPIRGGLSVDSQISAMPYTCQTCAKRKVKCDKAAPVCSRCRKGGFECVFQAPQPRPRKRKLDDVMEKMARYERILMENGLLDDDPPGTSKTGRLLTGQGRSRYIDSQMWFNLGDDEIQHITDEEEDAINPDSIPTLDPLTGAFLGGQQSLLYYHPSHADAMQLWKTHAENVEPLCKVLHIPSTGKMVESVSQRPGTSSKAEECLLFSIYHCAVFSMSDEECLKVFKQDRSTTMKRFQAAARQALVNASFLKTTEIAVLQALYLYLLSSRYAYDPHTYWILTGVSARIGQRIGLHRDGENLGLPPFEVEMRRRLFYQVFPHDSRASQSAGIDYISLPEAWDTKPPLNINDDQIWPGMTEKPVEQNGATEMMFCLSRAYVGKRLAESGKSINTTGPWTSDSRETEAVISAAESEVEEKFIRYCDIVNPLHLLTIGLARSGMTAMRLKLRLPKVRDQTATSQERKELFQLAQKTLATDSVVHSHGGTSRFQWHIKPFFLWGTRDSFVFILTTLLNERDLLSHEEIEAAWKSIAELYQNHDELFDSRQAFSMAMRCLALKAWDSGPSSRGPEPEFIRALRSLKRQCGLSPGADGFEGLEFDFGDWISWDQF
ncbi:hypothetical protein BDV18DRAFT_152709 [Aspergillus unguis]